MNEKLKFALGKVGNTVGKGENAGYQLCQGRHNTRIVKGLNSLPNNKILDWSKLKAFGDEKFIMVKMMISLCDMVENIVGKGENAAYQHFLLFPQHFEKLSVSGSLKVGIVW